ncbi:hypothetical protein FHS19_005136 [Paenibacillus rhizosphaerae]|uniref:Uncharacterized protein n=1 Tax=Paenibacillus rhizosphaerae TaxID=297318 RepID=A0A839TV98_9BACL|nr:hypothetical protein [Paenibacillus rhizosphaerae]
MWLLPEELNLETHGLHHSQTEKPVMPVIRYGGLFYIIEIIN